jgi:carbonic anhydrase/acetyltransferase-like protein (isoleucine patch superfamily)
VRNEPTLIEFEGRSPRIAAGAFVAPTAVLVGDVQIEENTSIWFNAVLRADCGAIRIARNCSVQDNVVMHAENPETGLILEEGVTVGHGAIVHGTLVEKGALIGMGAILLSGSVIGAGSVIAAGSVVLEHCRIPPNSLAAGNPAVVKKALTGNAARWADQAVDDYLDLVQRYARNSSISG